MKALKGILLLLTLTMYTAIYAKGPGFGHAHGSPLAMHSNHSSSHSHTTHIGHAAYLVYTAHSSHNEDPMKELLGSTYDGYLVYGGDTIIGDVTIRHGLAFVGTSIEGIELTSYRIDDSLLSAIRLNTQEAVLFMSRLPGQGEGFYRMVHSGKLSLYDDNLSFNYSPSKIDLSEMRVAYDGKIEEMNTFWTTFPKKRLVYFVNTVYGTALDARDYNKKTLLDYVASLN